MAGINTLRCDIFTRSVVARFLVSCNLKPLCSLTALFNVRFLLLFQFVEERACDFTSSSAVVDFPLLHGVIWMVAAPC